MELQTAYLKNRHRELREQLMHLKIDPGSLWWRLGVVLDKLALADSALDLLGAAVREYERQGESNEQDEGPRAG
jgi:hypothetical protein